MTAAKGRYSSIDIFRYICAILVIAIHTGPFAEMNPAAGFAAKEIIPRIAVPFFFMASGYFYIKKLRNGGKPFKQYMKRLVQIYAAWSLLYFLLAFAQWGYTDLKGFFVKCLLSFFFYGSAYHFWFFPALIYAVCFTNLLWKSDMKGLILPLSFVLYGIGVLGCSYYNIGKAIPVLGRLYEHPQFTDIRRIIFMGFPFFAGGQLVIKMEERISKRPALFLWASSIIIWLLEIGIVIKMRYQRSLVLTFGLYLLVLSTLIVLLKNDLPYLRQAAGLCRKLAGFTYYSHPAFILLINFAFRALGSEPLPIPDTALFFLTVVVTFIAGIVIIRFDNPKLNKLLI